MSARYAEGTTVSPDRSQTEISENLRRYGATSYVSGYEDNRAMIAFKAHDRTIRFILDLPMPGDAEFAFTPTRQRRKPDAARAAYEQEIRRRWRALALAIKAKLEAVATGIATFEDEFLAYTVLPDNTTVGDRVRGELEQAWRTGQASPRLLPQIGAAS
jgi:hypothetical protein